VVRSLCIALPRHNHQTFVMSYEPSEIAHVLSTSGSGEAGRSENEPGCVSAQDINGSSITTTSPASDWS